MKNRFLMEDILAKRILILDGAMGTMIQQYSLLESDFRGNRFENHELFLKGNNDILCLTQPQLIAEIHGLYLKAGADIIETNTFNAQSISQSDYETQAYVYEINYQAAKIARSVADTFSTNEKPRFVAGSIGPTNKSASLPSDVSNPALREITFRELTDAYKEQITALIEGGCDVLLMETIFDSLNAKACLYAANDVFKAIRKEVPIMVSATIADATGRLLSGQKLDAFLTTMSCFPILSIGLNCAFGAKEMMPFLRELSENASCYVSAHPNAGLPNQYGEYDQSPEQMAAIIDTYISEGLVNIIGGCCGTTPKHIALIEKKTRHALPRKKNTKPKTFCLSGLEILNINENINFIHIGERTNVAGSMKFAHLIREKKYEDALSIAKQQIDNGVQIIDVNLDDSMLDAEVEMKNFIRLISSDSDICRIPIMIDSSKWTVIEEALQNIQGKPIVNSISLKDGEAEFIHKAETIRNYGAAVVVMAFDEEGQANSFEKKINICKRAYGILVQRVCFSPEDIVFDCNVLTIGTGLQEHTRYAVDFIEAVRWIKTNLPGVKTSGGISNLSFSFRGNNYLREILHSVFLYNAIKAGLDMAIVNAGALPIYEDIQPEIRQVSEDLILNRTNDATERLMNLVSHLNTKQSENIITETWRAFRVSERLKYAIVAGISTYLEDDLMEAMNLYPKALTIIEEPFMEAMNQVGTYFSSGRMFLPQVLKSARTMKKAVAFLQPILEKQNHESGLKVKAGKILLATVKGDVHDIGKHIVRIVLECNNYEIIDLGIMVSRNTIIEEAINQQVNIIGLSGLISPSLDEMIAVASEMQKRNMKIPLIIGGATTSEIHTAVKIDSVYAGTVVQIKDASQCVRIVSDLLSRKENGIEKEIKSYYQQIRENQAKKSALSLQLSPEEARLNKFCWNKETADVIPPTFSGIKIISGVDIKEVIPYMDWTLFFKQWQINGKYPNLLTDNQKGSEANKLLIDGQCMLEKIIENKMLTLKAVIGFYEATSVNEQIEIVKENVTFDFTRNLHKKQGNKKNLCLADFIAPQQSNCTDYIGVFALTAGLGIEENEKRFILHQDDYSAIMLKVTANVLAEAFAEYLHEKVRKTWWGYSPDENLPMEDRRKGKYRGIRPAPGYSVCPDHAAKEKIFNILNVTEYIGVKLTEHWSMQPEASLCGFYFAHPEVDYFTLKD